jgi:hypothetical protein
VRTTEGAAHLVQGVTEVGGERAGSGDDAAAGWISMVRHLAGGFDELSDGPSGGVLELPADWQRGEHDR